MDGQTRSFCENKHREIAPKKKKEKDKKSVIRKGFWNYAIFFNLSLEFKKLGNFVPLDNFFFLIFFRCAVASL